MQTTLVRLGLMGLVLAPQAARAVCTFANGCHGVMTSEGCDCEGFQVACSVCGRSGTSVCTPECTIAAGSCSAISAEVCNGCDDNQDGFIDNPVPGQAGTMTQACTDGTGHCGGTRTCSSGSWGTCTNCSGVGTCTNACGQAVTPTCNASTCQYLGCAAPPEVCNGLDDDCNGQIDDNVCRQDGCACTASTCAQLGKTCGTWADGCGGMRYCGTCASGSVCNSGTCCQLATCQVNGCGTKSNGCGGTINCGTCAAGTCVNNVCQ